MSEKNYSAELDEMNGQIATIELHAGNIAEQLKRIADALDILAPISPEWKDRDAAIRINKRE